jgi:two-component system, cell cycle sensor histidine kinase and response regulator CckA
MTTDNNVVQVPYIDDDTNKVRAKNVLDRAILIFSILTGVGLIATALLYERKIGSLIIILALMITIIIVEVLKRQDKVQNASIFLVSAVWLIFFFIALMGGGLNNINVIFFVSMTVVSGLLLGEKATLIVAGAGITMGLGMALMDIFGYLPKRYFMSTPLGNWSELVFAVILTASTLNLALRERKEALNKAREQISDRIEAEKALKESEELYDRLVATIPDLVVRTNIGGEIQFINDMTLQVGGYERSELIGKQMLSFIAPEDQERAYRNTLLMMEHPLGPQQYGFVMKNGERLVFEVNGDVLRTENGVPYNIVHVLRDITDRVKMEKEREELQERLHRAQKMEALGLLAGGVAHDLNNILSGIVSYPELILMDLPEDSPLRKPIKTIHASGMRAADVVADLLTIARGVATGKRSLNLNSIVNEYLGSPEYQNLEVLHPVVHFKTDLALDLLNIRGSSSHLRKTLMNLVTNAMEAIDGVGTVTISTFNRYLDEPLNGYDDVRRGEYVVLSVSDNGRGISSKDLDRIFEPFYTKKVMGRSGTGLGLAVVWNTVQDHNGYINVQTGEEGTTFDLYFPVTREEITEKKDSIRLEEYRGQGEKILVVDDEESQREIATGILSKLGYHADAVSSGEEAIEYVRTNPVDLIVLDMVMPKGMNGRETYQEIIKVRPRQKAIIASGYAKTDEVDAAQKLGAGKYVKKPYTLEKIGIAVKEELGK